MAKNEVREAKKEVRQTKREVRSLREDIEEVKAEVKLEVESRLSSKYSDGPIHFDPKCHKSAEAIQSIRAIAKRNIRRSLLGKCCGNFSFGVNKFTRGSYPRSARTVNAMRGMPWKLLQN